jgi:hypothetical protein
MRTRDSHMESDKKIRDPAGIEPATHGLGKRHHRFHDEVLIAEIHPPPVLIPEARAFPQLDRP